jgi:hypothetical protein
MWRNAAWSLTIFSLLLLTFCLGLPQFHYTVALMIALILRHKDVPADEPLFALGPNPKRS